MYGTYYTKKAVSKEKQHQKNKDRKKVSVE
jgi:hypothetical protein